MSATEPVAPPPTRRKPAKVVQPAVEQPATAAPSTEVAHTAPADPGGIEQMLSGAAQAPAAERPNGQRPSYAAFMGLNRPVDPENDMTNGPNRYPKYLVAGMLFIKASTGKPLQQIASEAMSGKTPIPAVVLDEAFRELYGYDRPAVS